MQHLDIPGTHSRFHELHFQIPAFTTPALQILDHFHRHPAGLITSLREPLLHMHFTTRRCHTPRMRPPQSEVKDYHPSLYGELAERLNAPGC